MASMALGALYCGYNLLIYCHIPMPAFWKPQSTEQVLLGVVLSIVVYIVTSLCTKADYEKADAFIAAAKGRG